MAFDRYKGNMKFREQQSAYNDLLVKGTVRSIGQAQISHYRACVETFQTYQMFEKGVEYVTLKKDNIEKNFAEIGLISEQITAEGAISEQLHANRNRLLDDLNSL